MISLRSALLFLVLGLLPASTLAHENRPALLQITETQPDIYDILWKRPAGGLMRGDLYPVFPERCGQNERTVADYSYAQIDKLMLHCDGGLAGETVSISDLDLNIGVSAFVQISFLSGQSHSAVLFSNTTDYIVPAKENAAHLIRSYTVFGIEHILYGSDHLLFVFCLLLIVRTYKLLLWTITGFTLAHSASLVASVLDVVRLPSAYAETCIALSIVFLAAEILRGGNDSLSFRKPFLMSSLFGLFHGFGFADALLALGLPQTDIGLALLFFNLGVELGQVVIIFMLLCAGWLLRAAHRRFPSDGLMPVWPAQKLFCHAIGGVAAFWVFQRLENFV